MSKLILDKLKTIKPLVKGKGLSFEKYGVVKDGILYFSNIAVEVEIPIDIPFNCCIDLYQLTTLLSDIKGESVIVNKDNQVFVHYNDTDYNIETLPLDALDNTLHFFNDVPSVQCNKPFIFKSLCKIAEDYVQAIENKMNIKYATETMIVDNGIVMCSDQKNIIQGMLDFGMPNLAIPLETLISFNKIASKNDIVAMGMTADNLYLLIEFDNGLKCYLQNLQPYDPAKVVQQAGLLNGALSKVWDNPTVVIPDYVKQQIKMVNKISLQNVVHLTSSFCQANNSQIHYPSFTDDVFAFKAIYRHIAMALAYGHLFGICEKGLSFLSEDNHIRGFIGRMLSDDPRG